MMYLAEEITRAWEADDEIAYSQDSSLLRSVNRDLVREVCAQPPALGCEQETRFTMYSSSQKSRLVTPKGSLRSWSDSERSIQLGYSTQRVGRVHPMMWDHEPSGRLFAGTGCSCKGEVEDLRESVKARRVLHDTSHRLPLQQRLHVVATLPHAFRLFSPQHP